VSDFVLLSTSSLLRLRDFTNYEGQAAIELEQIADPAVVEGYQFEISPEAETISAQPVVRGVINDLLNGLAAATVAAKFHVAVADLIRLMACEIRQDQKLIASFFPAECSRISCCWSWSSQNWRRRDLKCSPTAACRQTMAASLWNRPQLRMRS
jgi:hypothetical protein